MRSVPLKHLVDPRRPVTYGIVQAGPDTPGGVPYIRPTDMTATGGVADTATLLRTTPEVAATYKRSEVRPGDVVVSIGPSYGKVMVIPSELSGANLTQGTARLAPATNVYNRFLYWVLQSKAALDYWDMAVAGATFRALNLGPLAETPIPTLPLEEQQRIADFLDAEVGRLDRALRLTRDQQHILAERQQALVRASVVGLNEPGSRLDSPTTWIGSVPETWSIQPIGRRFDVQLGKMLAPDRVSGDHERPYLRNTNVQWDRIDTSDLLTMNFAPAEQARYRVEPGDLLVCEGGDIGRAAIWDGSIAEVYYQKALHRVRPRSTTSVRWLYYVLRAATRLGVFTAEGGLSTIAHLTGEQLRAHRIPIPPADVEPRLISEMDERAVVTSRLVGALTKRLAFLEERKQALITAAVTGQFDVTTARVVA